MDKNSLAHTQWDVSTILYLQSKPPAKLVVMIIGHKLKAIFDAKCLQSNKNG